MENKEAFRLFRRYIIIILLGLFNLKLFYLVFEPLTVRPTFAILSALYDNATILADNLLFFGGIYAHIIPACIAGSAYYLLLILNMTTPMSVGRRLKSLLFLFLTFLIVNVIRIVLFATIATTGQDYFDVAHKLMWYFGSTILVVIIWFVNVWIFKIRDIPIYTDVKNLYKEVVSGKKE